MKKASLLLFALLPLCVSAQKMVIKKMELVNSRLIVNYEIEDPNQNNEYKVSLFASRDNYSAPLSKVKGDIGPEVKPGLNRVEWDIKQEFGDFKGSIAVELRAAVFIPFVRLKTFSTSRNYKRGKTYPLEWRPGNTNPVHIELFNGTQRLQGELNHPNNGTYTVNFEKRLKPGKNYRLKITDSKHPEDFLYSENFKVRRKFPLLIKILPLVGVGYLASQLLIPDDGADSNSLPTFPEKPE
jgi:hypothetical protein